MVGVSKGGDLLDIGITSHSETPGIGAKVSETFFTERFKGLATNQEIKVDGSVVHPIQARV